MQVNISHSCWCEQSVCRMSNPDVNMSNLHVNWAIHADMYTWADHMSTWVFVVRTNIKFAKSKILD